MRWIKNKIFKLVDDVVRIRFINIEHDIESLISSQKEDSEKIQKNHNDLNAKIGNIIQRLETKAERQDVLNITTTKVSILSEEIDTKINGLMVYVKDRTAVSRNGEDNIELLKKLARLEDLSDKIEYRRITEEVMARRQQLVESMEGLNREDRATIVIQAQIDILDWVLGGKDE